MQQFRPFETEILTCEIHGEYESGTPWNFCPKCREIANRFAPKPSDYVIAYLSNGEIIIEVVSSPNEKKALEQIKNITEVFTIKELITQNNYLSLK